VGWAAREEREELFLGAACVLCSLVCSAALVLLALLVLWGSLSLLFPVSDWGFLIRSSYTHILRHISNFFLVLLDAFSSRFFKTNVLFSHYTFLFYNIIGTRFNYHIYGHRSRIIHQFHVSSSFCFFYLARCSFRLFPNFRWDALWGIYSDVTLPYLTLPYQQRLRCYIDQKKRGSPIFVQASM